MYRLLNFFSRFLTKFFNPCVETHIYNKIDLYDDVDLYNDMDLYNNIDLYDNTDLYNDIDVLDYNRYCFSFSFFVHT